MNEREALLQRIRERPDDISARLVYADWLEEQGDPLAPQIREICRLSKPYSNHEESRLKAVHSALSGPLEPIELQATPQAIESTPLSATGKAELRDVVHALSDDRLVRSFPRDARGRLSLRTRVVLEQFPAIQGPPNGQDLVLAAVGPERRRDPQVVRIALTKCITANEELNWTRVRYKWCDGQSEPTTQVAELAPLGHMGQLTMLTGLNTRSPDQEVALSLLKLDSGMFLDALRSSGVTWSRDVAQMIEGHSFALDSDWAADDKVTLKRTQRIRHELWASQPWHFADALTQHADRLNARRRHHKPVELYLYMVPGQPTAARRARLTLSARDGAPHLDFRWTASNVKPWRWTWTRPVNLDVQRWLNRVDQG